MTDVPPQSAPRVLTISAAAFVLLSVIGLVYATQNWIVGGPYGRLSWPRNLTDAMVQWWGWAALAPLVLALTAKAPIQPGALRRGLLIYLAVGLALAGLHLLGASVLQRGLERVTPGEAFGQTLFNLFKKRIGLNLLTFWALVLLGHAGVYYARWRGQEQAARAAPSSSPVAGKLAVRGRAGTVLVDPADVAWVEAAGNYAVLHTAGGDHMMRATLEELAGQLGEGFVRVSRSALANLAHVEALGERTPQGDLTVSLKGGTRLRLTRTYRAAVLERLPPAR